MYGLQLGERRKGETSGQARAFALANPNKITSLPLGKGTKGMGHCGCINQVIMLNSWALNITRSSLSIKNVTSIPLDNSTLVLLLYTYPVFEVN